MKDNNLLSVLNTFSLKQPDQGEKAKGNLFEKAVLAFFRCDKQQQLTYQTIYRYSDFAKKYNASHPSTEPLPVQDLGIDLVATNFNGDYFAVQCKFHTDPQHVVTSKEIASFRALVGALKIFRGGGGGAILATTSDQFPGPNLKKIIKSTENYEWIWLNLNQLNDASFNWSDWISGNLIQRNIPPLRLYQENAVNSVIEKFKTDDRGKLIMACGTGKTRTALEITQEWISQNSLTKAKILVLVPSINLVQQVMSEFCINRKKDFFSIVICSDPSTGTVKSRDQAKDEILELIPVPVLSTSKSIANYIINTPDQKPIIVFSTYQSLQKISVAQFASAGEPQFTFDLIICDEAHRTTGKVEKSTDRLFKIVHDNQKIKGRKRLYMTATPKIYKTKDSVKLARLERSDIQVISMDDEAIFGSEFYKYSFNDAIKGKDNPDPNQDNNNISVLSKYELIIMESDRDEISPRTREKLKEILKELNIFSDTSSDKSRLKNEIKEWEGKNYFTKLLGSFQAIGGQVVDINNQKVIPRPLSKVISFNRTIQWSKFNSNPEIVSLIQQIGQTLYPNLRDYCWNWRHIDNKTPLYLRKQDLTWLESAKNKTRIISNVRCLGEGVDIPALDAVLFLDPKQSTIEIIQAIGRVMRKAKGKTKGYIIIPITYNKDALKSNPTRDDPELIRQNKEWAMIIKVINALVSCDEELRKDLLTYKINSSFPWGEKKEDQHIEEPLKKKIRIVRSENWKTKTSEQISLLEHIDLHIRACIIPAAGPRPFSQPEYMHYIGQIAKDIKSKIDLEKHQYKSEITELQQNISKYWETECSFDDALQLTIQHLVIQPCFARIFSDIDWIKTNPVAKTLNQMVTKFKSFFKKKVNSDGVWDYFLLYLKNSIKKLKKIKHPVEKSQKTNNFLTNFFNDFWRFGFKEEQEKYGIVYTPPRVIQWMVSGLDYLIKTELKISTGIKDPKIKIIDPFFGTGSFLTYLVKHYGIKNPIDFISNKIFGSEIQPVAYYWTWITLLNFMQNQVSEKTLHTNIYKLNQNLLWSDTFKLDLTNKGQIGLDFWPTLSKLKLDFCNRIQPINIIIANPPYKKIDVNHNIRQIYPQLKNFITQEVCKFRHKYKPNPNIIYNLASFSIAWMIQLLETSKSNFGIIALICPNTFVRKDAPAMRDWFNHHFTKIYSFDLRGNFNDLRRRGVQDEGENIFGNRSKAGIQILFLVWHRRPQYNHLGTFYYLDINQLLGNNPKTTDHKLTVLKDHSFSQLVTDHKFNFKKLNSDGGWIQKTINQNYFWEINKVFTTGCRGYEPVSVGFLFNFSDSTLMKNIHQWWQQNLFSELIDQKYLTFLHQVPFVLTRAYVSRIGGKSSGSVDPNINQPWTYLGLMIPKRSLGSNFTAWAINLHNHPFYRMYFHYINFYPFRTPSSTHSSLLTTSQYNLKPDFISFMQYPNHPVSEHDIFCYIYGLLWSSDYRTYIQKYVWTHPPAICKFKSWSLFSDIVKIGRQLIDLHTTWEKIDINRIEHYGANLNLSADSYRIHKIKWAQTTIIINSKSKKVNVQSRIIFNNLITLKNIPESAYFLKFDGVAAVKHFMNHYQRKFDKKTGILNDPNEFVLVEQNPCYLLETLLKIIHISTETKKLVDQIPNLNFEVQNLVSKK